MMLLTNKFSIRWLQYNPKYTWFNRPRLQAPDIIARLYNSFSIEILNTSARISFTMLRHKLALYENIREACISEYPIRGKFYLWRTGIWTTITPRIPINRHILPDMILKIVYSIVQRRCDTKKRVVMFLKGAFTERLPWRFDIKPSTYESRNSHSSKISAQPSQLLACKVPDIKQARSTPLFPRCRSWLLSLQFPVSAGPHDSPWWNISYGNKPLAPSII